MKHFSAHQTSWCHLKIAADTLIFKQNRRDVDYLFSFTLILLLNQLPFFPLNFKTTKLSILTAAAARSGRLWMLTWQLQSTKAFFNAIVPISASIPWRNYTENIFCSGRNSSYRIWLWSIYLWGKINLQCFKLFMPRNFIKNVQTHHNGAARQMNNAPLSFQFKKKKVTHSGSLLEALPRYTALWATGWL